MLAAVTAARERHGAATGSAAAPMCETAAALYLESVTRAHLPPADPPADPRPNPTSGRLIKALLESSLKRSREAARARGDGAVAMGVLDDGAVAEEAVEHRRRFVRELGLGRADLAQVGGILPHGRHRIHLEHVHFRRRRVAHALLLLLPAACRSVLLTRIVALLALWFIAAFAMVVVVVVAPGE